jgi:hypothetical protein
MADITQLDILGTDPEVLGLQRQRQLANLLTGQAFNQPQGQMISGHYVKPSALQQALPMINAAIGGLSNANLDTKQTELAAALRGKQQEAMQNYMKASQGTPAQMYEQQAGPMPSGGNIPQQVQREATGPNYGEMFRAGTGQYASPQLQAAAYKLLEPIHTKEGETVTQRNLGAGGGMTPISVGGIALPAELKSAAIRLGLDPTKSATWGPRELAAIDAKVLQDIKAGGTHFNFTDILGKDIGQVKDLLTASQTRVQAGEMSINAATKIDQAIKSGNLNVGPGATVGQYMGQVGDALGLVNEKGQDKLVNTRSAIQGLAQMWATSRTQGKGQGAMDQQESQLYGKISSGEIDKISIPELKYMVEQTKSQGNFFRQEHTRMLNELKKDEKLKNIVPFYEVGYMPTPPGNPSLTSGSGKVKYLGPVE